MGESGRGREREREDVEIERGRERVREAVGGSPCGKEIEMMWEKEKG